MAQDLQKTPMGSAMVRDTPGGKIIDQADAQSASLAALANLHQRVSGLEQGGGRSAAADAAFAPTFAALNQPTIAGRGAGSQMTGRSTAADQMAANVMAGLNQPTAVSQRGAGTASDVAKAGAMQAQLMQALSRPTIAGVRATNPTTKALDADVKKDVNDDLKKDEDEELLASSGQ